jgi:hypothetical protein
MMSELPRETVVTHNQTAQPLKSSSPTSKTNAALSTHAAHNKNAKVSLVQILFQLATTVKNWLLFNTTSAAAHTNADVSEASVLNSVIVHAQKVTKDLLSMVPTAVQLPDVFHVKVQQSSLVQHHQSPTSAQPPSHNHHTQHILGLQLNGQPRLFHQLNATQFASTTRVNKFTMVPAGHQLHAHTVNATLTVMFNARRPNVLQ